MVRNTKADRVMMLQCNYTDNCYKHPEIRGEGNAETVVDNATNNLEYRDIIATVKVGKSGLGTGELTSFCRSTNIQKMDAVVKEFRQVVQEKDMFIWCNVSSIVK